MAYSNSSENPDTTTRTVTFVVNDGTADSNLLPSTIDITAVNDAAVIGNPTSAVVTEDQAGVGSGNLTASGTISISDVDSIAAFQTMVTGAAGNLGSLLLNSDGSYIYTVSNNAVQYLNSGEIKVDTFTITAADSTQKDVAFTIHGIDGSVFLSAGTVTVQGTSGADTISVTEGATLTVALNGTSFNFDGTLVDLITIDGLESADRLVFTGTPLDETVSLRPGQLDVRGQHFSVHASSVENVQAYAAGGANDVASLYDSAGNDMFVGKPTYCQMSGSGYSSYVSGFDQVYAYATAGDAGGVGDRAYLYDSAGNDTLIASPYYAQLMGPGYLNHVSAFDKVYAYASTDAGGVGDRATLYDSAGNDSFFGTPTYAQLSSPGHLNYASNFDQVNAYSTAGDAGGEGDQAVLYDSAGNDTFVGRPEYTLLKGAGFYNYVQGFDRAYGYATAGNAGGVGDQAFLYDSAGNDTFVGRPEYGLLKGAGFYNYAQGFGEVTANATAGDAGGVGDQATLYDSSGNDTFIGTPKYGLLKGPGFQNLAQGFDQVNVYATAGDAGGVGDQATLYDSAGNDIFVGRPEYSLMKGTGFYNYVQGFDHVYGYATAGDVGGVGDQATLYDSAGTDNFVGRPEYSLLKGSGFYNYVQGFDHVYAYATPGGFDQADVYDGPGDDTLYARADYGWLKGATSYNYFKGFALVNAYANAGGADTLDVHSISFDFRHFGTWENIL